MNKFKYVAFLATALVVLAACAPNAPDSAADVAAIKADGQVWYDLYNAGDADGVAALYAEDGVVMAPGAPAAVGRASIRDYIASDIANSKAAGLTSKGDEVTDGAAEGNMAWIRGSFSVIDASGTTVDTGKYLTVYRRTNGQWQIIRDIWNSEIPLPGVTATSYSTTIGNDAVIADPQHYTVEFENDKVRIVRIKYGPGEKSVMHTHGPNAAIFLTTNAVRMTLPDGSSAEVTGEAGHTQWTDAEEHLPENLSDDPLEVVLVEVKE